MDEFLYVVTYLQWPWSEDRWNIGECSISMLHLNNRYRGSGGNFGRIMGRKAPEIRSQQTKLSFTYLSIQQATAYSHGSSP